MPTLINTSNLSLSAGNKTLCAGLNWQVKAGQVWGLLGLNGAGKTTLLHTLAGIHTPQEGEVMLWEQCVSQWPAKVLAKKRGLLLQHHHDPFPGKVIDYVLMGRHPYLHALQWESDEDFLLAEQTLKTVGLEGMALRDIDSLSGGEYQRMAIAMILLQAPELYLLDEPVNHLDLPFQHLILKLFSDVMRAHSGGIVMSLHDINLAARYCSHVMLIFEQGQIQFGPVNEILTEPNLSQLYHHPIKLIEHDGIKNFIAI